MLTKYPDFDMILLRPESSQLSCWNWSLASSPIAKTVNWTPINLWVNVLDSQMRYKGTPNTASDVWTNSKVYVLSASAESRPASVNTWATYNLRARIWDIFNPFSDNNVVGWSLKRFLKIAPCIKINWNTRPIMRDPSLTITVEPKLLHSDWSLTTIFSKNYSHSRSWDKDASSTWAEDGINSFDRTGILIVEEWLPTQTATEWDLIVVDIKWVLNYTKYNSYTTAYSAYVWMRIDFGYAWSINQDNQPKPIQIWIEA